MAKNYEIACSICKYYDPVDSYCGNSKSGFTNVSSCGMCREFKKSPSQNGVRMLTHSELVEVGMRLAEKMGYMVMISEPGYRRESPDVIGFKDDDSLLIECKASRSDFLKDRKKPFRADGDGVGKYRIYLTNPNVCKVSEVPPKWMLAVAVNPDTDTPDFNSVMFLKPYNTNLIQEYKNLAFEERNFKGELSLLYSWTYRVRHDCLKEVPRTGKVLKICYAEPPKRISDIFEKDGWCGFCKHRKDSISHCDEQAIGGSLKVYRGTNRHRKDDNPNGVMCEGYEPDLEYIFKSKEDNS